MKKIICLVLVLVLVCLSLVACGGNSNNVELNEEAIGAIAFSKWLDEDMQANLLYNNNDCVWTASITPQEDGAFIVQLALHERDTYNSLVNAGMNPQAYAMAVGQIELSQDDLR